VVPLSRTYDFFSIEGSPTEPGPVFQFNHAKSVRPLCHASCVNGLWFATRGCPQMSRQPGVEVKLLLIGGLVGLVIGVVLTVFYFSLATFFAVNAKALEATQKPAENRNETAEDQSKLGRVDPCNPSLGREVHLPQKTNPGKVKEHSNDNTPDLCTH